MASTADAWRLHAMKLQAEVHAALRPGRPVVIVDLPPYLNIGDSLISLGELTVLNKPGIDLRGAYGAKFPDRVLQEIDSAEGTIAIHGGGNLGTIWPNQQALKERIAKLCPRARIVQLPQSIHFDSDDSAAAAFAVLRSHPDFILFVRDEPSRDLAVAHGMQRVTLAIDSAFLYDMGDRVPSIVDACVLARVDREKRVDGLQLTAALERRGFSTVACDWAAHADLPANVPRWRVRADKTAMRLIGRSSSRGRFLGSAAFAAAFFRNRRTIGVRVVCTGRVLVTDRLHAHVLSVLLGQPHVWLDNTYGKIARFAAAWGTESPIARRARSEEEAVLLVDELLQHSDTRHTP